MGNRNLAAKYRGEAVRLLSQLKMGIQPFISRVFPDGTQLQILRGPVNDIVNVTSPFISGEKYADVYESPLLIFFWFVSTGYIGVLRIIPGLKEYKIAPYIKYLGDNVDTVGYQSTHLVCQSNSKQQEHIVAFPSPPFTYYHLSMQKYGAWTDPVMIGNSSCFVPPWIEGYDETYQSAYSIATTYASRHPYELDDDGFLIKWDIQVNYDLGNYEKSWKTIGMGDGWTIPIAQSEPFTLPKGSYSLSITGSEYIGGYAHEIFPPPLFCDLYIGTYSYNFSDTKELEISNISTEESGESSGSLVCLLGDTSIYYATDTSTAVTTTPEDIGAFIIKSLADASLSVRYLSADDEDACNWPTWLSGVCTGSRVTTYTYNYSATKAETSTTQQNKYYLGGELFKTLSSTYSGTSHANTYETSYTANQDTTLSGPNVAYCSNIAQIECDPGDCSGCDTSLVYEYTELDVTKTGEETSINRSLSFLDYDHTWDGSVIFVLYAESVQTMSRETETRFYRLEGGDITEEATLVSSSNETTTTYYVAIKVEDQWYHQSLGTTEPEEFSCQLNSKFAVFTYILSGARKMGVFNVDSTIKLDLGYYQEFDLTADSLRAIDEYGNNLSITIDDYAVIGAHFLSRRCIGQIKIL
jgi:hypothetical protein